MKKELRFFKKIFIFSISTLIFSCGSDTVDNTNNDIKDIENIDSVDDDETSEMEDDQTDITTNNIVWKNWYLSIPIKNASNKATSITYQDIIDNNLSPTEAEYFSLNEDGSYKMFTKFTGFTTSGQYSINEGKYCRTELREYWQGNQDTNDNWYMDSGTHILESTLKVDFAGGNNDTKVYVAQIHGKETDNVTGNPATVKIMWLNGEIIVDYYTKPKDGEEWSSNYDNKISFGNVENEKFTVKIKIENGVFYFGLLCDTQNIDTKYTKVFDYKSNGYIHSNYFKTGNYFIWDKDSIENAQVTLYDIITNHF